MACYGSLHAQSVPDIPSDPVRAYDRAITVPPDPKAAKHYNAPEIPKGWVHWTTYEGKYFSYKIGLVFLLDYDGFWQDSNNLVQVGRQKDQWDLRSERISLGGRIGHNLPIIYLLATEFKGFDRPPGARSLGSTEQRRG